MQRGQKFFNVNYNIRDNLSSIFLMKPRC